MKTKLIILIVVFVLVAAGCSLLQPTPSSPTAAIEPTIQAAATTEPLFTETDACKLFDEIKACNVLGEAVLPPAPASSAGYSVCPFSPAQARESM